MPGHRRSGAAFESGGLGTGVGDACTEVACTEVAMGGIEDMVDKLLLDFRDFCEAERCRDCIDILTLAVLIELVC